MHIARLLFALTVIATLVQRAPAHAAAPAATNDTYQTFRNIPLTVPAPGVLANDTDADNDPLTASRVTLPTSGTVTLSINGGFIYTPASNFSGNASFTYRVSDGTNTSNTATVTITVVIPPLPPVAAADSYSTPANTALDIAAPGVLGNDADENNDPLTATLVNDVGHGSLVFSNTGAFVYTPTNDFLGTDNFQYRAHDGTSNSAPVTVMIKVNTVPVVSNSVANVNEDEVLTVPAPGVLAFATDPDPQTLTPAKISGPSHGTLTLNTDGSYVYTPATNYHGADSFTWKVNDTLDDSSAATVNITVNSIPDAPVAQNDSYGTPLNTPRQQAAPGVLANDTDGDNNPLNAILVTPPGGGTLSFNSDGSFLYIPVSNFTGFATFTYKANDGTNDSDVASVIIGVNTNTPPVANNDSYTMFEDDTLTVPVSGVLTNDTDPRQDPLTAVLVSNVTHGVLNLSTNGSFTYMPANNYNGPDSFTYMANDGEFNSASATANITVKAVNGAGDIDLCASAAAFTVVWSDDHRDSFSLKGKINPRGADQDPSGALFLLKLNGTELWPALVLDSGGRASGSSSNGQVTASFNRSTGDFSYSLKNADLDAVLGIPNQTHPGTAVLNVELIITDAALDLPLTAARLQVPYQAKTNQTAKGKFKYATNNLLTGAFRWENTQITQTKDGKFDVSCSGLLEAEGGGNVARTGNIKATLGGQVLTFPAASKELVLDTKKRGFKLNVQDVPPAIGIPIAGTGAATAHDLPVMFEIPVSGGGTNIFETIIELRRSSSTSTKWQQ